MVSPASITTRPLTASTPVRVVVQVCEGCSEKFARSAKDFQKVTCSKACRKTAKHRKTVEAYRGHSKPCVKCGETFAAVSPDDITCGLSCLLAYKASRPSTKQQRQPAAPVKAAPPVKTVSLAKSKPVPSRVVGDKEKRASVTDFRCPKPFKKSHLSFEKAMDFILEHHKDDKLIKPYTCRCGAIHIGH